jgi:anti-sigma factor RsiW
MRCWHARKMISRYVDGELSPDEKKDFDLHLRKCASCRQGLEETRALHRMFVTARRFPAPYGFATRVLANLEEQRRVRLGRLAPIRPLLLRAAQVTSVLVIMTIGMISGNLLLPKKTEPIGQTAVQQTFSLDLFQATPPDSIGGIYTMLMRPGHER